MKKLKLVKHVLTLAIVLALTLVVSSIPVEAAPADLTPYVTVTSWGFYHANGTPVSTTDPLPRSNMMSFAFDWSVNLPSGQTINPGDTFRLPIPSISGQGNFLTANSEWQNFHSADSTLLGEWRVSGGAIEATLAVGGISLVTGSFATGPVFRHDVVTAGVRDVSFAGDTRTMNFQGTNLNHLTSLNQTKAAATVSSSTIRWRLDLNYRGVRELGGRETGHPRGEYFTLIPGFFVEDTLSGDLGTASFLFLHFVPFSLDPSSPYFGWPAGAAGVTNFNAHMTRIVPNSGESRTAFRDRVQLQPFQWGVWEEPGTGTQTLMAYFGTLGQDGPRAIDINPNAANDFANIIINAGFYMEEDRDCLIDHWMAVYGPDNVIGGRIGVIRIDFTETFNPVSIPLTIPNTMYVTYNGQTTSSSASATLQPADGGGVLAPNTARLVLVDQDTNVPLQGATFELEEYDNGDWIPTGQTFTTNAAGSFNTPALGTGTFRFRQTSVSSAAYVLNNPLHNSYNPTVNAPTSGAFTTAPGQTGVTEIVFNVRSPLPDPPAIGIRKELRLPAGVDVPTAEFEFDITLVSVFPTPPALTVVTIPNPSVTFDSTMTPILHPDGSGDMYVHAYIPVDLSGVNWPAPGVYRFRVTEVVGSSNLGSNPDNIITYDPAVFYLYVYVGRESGNMLDPLEILGYYARRRVPTGACNDCEEDEYCATCDYTIIKDPVLMPFRNRFSRRPVTTSFEVTKVVTGNMANTNLSFDFEIEMLLPESTLFPLSNAIEATITGYARDVNGQIIVPLARVTVSTPAAISVNSATREATHTFSLRHGDTIVFSNVPVGTTYDVIEAYAAGYIQTGVATIGGVDEPTVSAIIVYPYHLLIPGVVSLPANDTAPFTNIVTVTNAHDGTPPMGVLLSNIPFGLMVALGAGALSLIAAAVIVGSKVKTKR